MTPCRACGNAMMLPGYDYHPGCQPPHEPFHETGETPYDMEVKTDIWGIIEWGAKASDRSQQVSLGCSEVGHPCDRRVGMVMAARPTVNFTDPLPSIVGTAVHAWMEATIKRYQQVHDLRQWRTEIDVQPHEYLPGHCDLYDTERCDVLDWKFPGKNNFAAFVKNGWQEHRQYRVQLHLYGKGIKKLGLPVNRVGIVALRREGWLKDLYLKTEPFDEGVADEAIDRMLRIGARLIDMDITEHPELWAQIPATSDFMCTFCPFYRGGTDPADSTGCPGK